ncbi:hypothetical protein GCM10010289_54940 [Streptomyces violascens]|uniref:Uncharacterized protein n=1 Tax=Streptomyces violascens TaxID=67381 RepID=A0ABQ3QVB8_9ACTN|nr:hypothetical protein GCM10010289_54940 [Streptomyces violascens]GHI41231.1 hypothetical protein Sviol_56390 [Streptomyces violascens]
MSPGGVVGGDSRLARVRTMQVGWESSWDGRLTEFPALEGSPRLATDVGWGSLCLLSVTSRKRRIGAGRGRNGA